MKARALYLFLVEVRQVVPLPEDKVDGQNIKKRLALWLHSALPDNDPLKQQPSVAPTVGAALHPSIRY